MPAWRLGKLAVYVDVRRDKDVEWGRHLLRDALETIVRVADVGGGKVIVVDADRAEEIPSPARAELRMLLSGCEE